MRRWEGSEGVRSEGRGGRVGRMRGVEVEGVELVGVVVWSVE